MDTSPEGDVDEARTLIERLLQLRPKLRGPTVVGALRHALGSAERQWALYLLLLADPSLVTELLPEILVAGLRPRDGVLVREIMGRLPREVLQSKLGPVTRDRLTEADDEEFRRLAELLQHVGLTAELAHLITVAKESDDPNIKEIATDFGP